VTPSAGRGIACAVAWSTREKRTAAEVRVVENIMLV
jgi:hypothetical protein